MPEDSPYLMDLNLFTVDLHHFASSLYHPYKTMYLKFPPPSEPSSQHGQPQFLNVATFPQESPDQTLVEVLAQTFD